MLRTFIYLLTFLLFTTAVTPSNADEFDDDLLAPRRVEDDSPVDITEADTTAVSSDFSIRYLARYSYAEPIPSEVADKPYRIAQKLRFDDHRGLTLLFAVEKDPGESNLLDHVLISGKLKLQAIRSDLILGNYLVRSGHGLVVNTARNYGLGTWSNHLLKFPQDACRISDSWTEETALYGLAVNTRTDWFSSSIWASSRLRDADLDSNGVVNGFRDTGYHRTANEMDDQDSVEENIVGVRAGFPFLIEKLRFGTTWHFIKWDKPVDYQNRLYDETWGGGGDLSYINDAVTFTTEAAIDQNYNSAFMSTFKFDRVDLNSHFVLYHVSHDYFAPLAQSLDFDLGDVRNRQGGYATLNYRFSSKSQIYGYFHLYRFVESQESQSTGGRDYYLKINQEFNQQFSAAVTSHWTEEDIETVSSDLRWRGSAKARFTPPGGWDTRLKLDLAASAEDENLGRLIQLHLKRKWNVSHSFDLQTSLKGGLYSTDSYASRLFWAAQDLSRIIQFHSVWDDGKIVEISARAGINKIGKFELNLLWDQPQNESGREPYRSFRFIYQYR
ncbi:MAG: hypothetical protein ABIE92_15445 [bacterium]